MTALCTEFAVESKPEETRQLAGLYLKNMITAKNIETHSKQVQQWTACEPAIREGARQTFMSALGSPVKTVSHTAAQVLAAYGSVDIPNGEFSTLVPTIVAHVSSAQVPDMCKIACLECLGYLCDALDADARDLSKETTDQILTAIVSGMHVSRSVMMREVATQALQNTLAFAEKNFQEESARERDMIMESIRSAMICPESQKVRELAYQCVASVAELYYDFLQPYIQEIYNLSMESIRKDESEVGIQAIEFWSTVCREEIERNDELLDGATDVRHLFIMKKVTPVIVPIMLEAFSKQEEDIDDDNWSLDAAAQSFLGNLSECVQDDVVGHVLPYVQQHITSTKWNFRDAAVTAFGFIMEGPSDKVLHPIIGQAMTIIIQLSQDAHEHVAHSALWTMAKICEKHKTAIPAQCIELMISAIVAALDRNSSKVQGKACLAVHNLALACEETADHPTNLLSHFFQSVVQKVLTVASAFAHQDGEADNTLNAYEAVNMMVQNSAQDMLPLVHKILEEALRRLEATFAGGNNLTGQQRMALHGYLSSLIGYCVQKIEINNQEISDKIIQSLLMVVKDTNSSALQDAYMSLGFMVDKLEKSYERYAGAVTPFLFAALDKEDDYATCTTVVGVFGDICRAIGPNVVPICDNLVAKMFDLLKSTTVEKVVKPHVISLFSDIAMAIEGSFDKYASSVLLILQKAAASAQLSNDAGDDDMNEFVYNIRESILEAYTGIICGLREHNKHDMLTGHIENMLKFAIACCEPADDPERPPDLDKGAVGLVGDLIQTFQSPQLLANPNIARLVDMGCKHEDVDVRETAKWVLKLRN